jgi:polyisoprenoid-binding protein YceI
VLSQLLSLSPRRLISLGLIVSGLLIGILLIILWQAGLFDSAPPPASLESAVESVRQEQQQDQEAQGGSSQAQTEEQQSAQLRQDDQAQSSSDQDQQDAAEDPAPEQSQSADAADQQDDAPTDQDQDQDQVQAEQAQSGEERQASQGSQAQQSQEQAQDSEPLAEQQAEQEAQQQVMTPEAPELADLAGTWVLSQQGESFVGYRIGEELANIGTTTAVGRTGDVVVTLEFDGAAITSVVIEADLRTLKSDQAFRDGALRTRGIETDIHPFATFVLSEPIPIDALPEGEEALSASVQGTLNLHGVTNPVSIALQGQYVDGLVVVVGSTEIALADYDIEPPTGFRVLSIDDIGLMEFQLVLERAP